MPISRPSRQSLALLAMTCALAAGCNLNPADSKPLTHAAAVSNEGLPAGWTRAEDRASRLSIGVAPGWKPKNLTVGTLKAGLDQIAKDNPSKQQDMSEANKIAGTNQLKLFVAHPPVNGIQFAPNINVIETSAPRGMSLEQLTNVSMLDLGGYTDIKKLPNEHLAIGEATVTTAKQTLNYHGSPLNLDLTFYLALSGKNAVFITVTLPDGSNLTKDADAMAKTLSAGQ